MRKILIHTISKAFVQEFANTKDDIALQLILCHKYSDTIDLIKFQNCKLCTIKMSSKSK